MSDPTDVRDPDPDKSARRLRVFRDGWADAVDEGRDPYTEKTLTRLTWQNLGWRLGSVVGATSIDLIEEMYHWCVRQQEEAGVTRTDD